ncbi:UNVERIFIED_CONTAM: hypothetical protein PYX00_009849 [Menopon gallinae]|uniref:Uncharacterized protein n=1 Tax=Menopon gallinae TaxID=328185 RepID=A0AAW2HD77_9NEOP
MVRSWFLNCDRFRTEEEVSLRLVGIAHEILQPRTPLICTSEMGRDNGIAVQKFSLAHFLPYDHWFLHVLLHHLFSPNDYMIVITKDGDGSILALTVGTQCGMCRIIY